MQTEELKELIEETLRVIPTVLKTPYTMLSDSINKGINLDMEINGTVILALSTLWLSYIFIEYTEEGLRRFGEKALFFEYLNKRRKLEKKGKIKSPETEDKPAQKLKYILDMDFIDRSGGLEFEKILGIMFSDLGFKVKFTDEKADYGVDLLLTDPETEKVVAVQAKRWKQPIHAKAVQEVYSGKDYYDADEAWVVTNSKFTYQTVKMANKLGVKLIDRKKLIEYILMWKNNSE